MGKQSFQEALDVELLIESTIPVLRGLANQLELIDAELQPARDRVPKALAFMAEARESLEKAAKLMQKRR